jgi:hypothetical protein
MEMSDLMLNKKMCLEGENSEWSVYEPRISPTIFQISKNIDT